MHCGNFVLLSLFALACAEPKKVRRSPIPVPVVAQPMAIAGSERARDQICAQKNARYPVAEYCDNYIECRNFIATEMVCPDGLHFSPLASLMEYPCVYPIDSPCQGKSSMHAAQPTEACPHQFGFFRLGGPKSCGEFRSCVAGNGLNFRCPEGLAFNPLSYDCDWPENVADCDVPAFLGFKCPAAPMDSDGNEFNGIIPFPYPNDCRKFYACSRGNARLLRCDEGMAFDARSSRCEPADTVPGCGA